MRIKNASVPPNGYVTQSRWISIKPESLLDDKDLHEASIDSSVADISLIQPPEEPERYYNNTAMSRSTLANKQPLINNAEFSKHN
jgi:hypothetical protein